MKLVANLFKNKKYGDDLRTNGFVKFPLLNTEKTNELIRLYENLKDHSKVDKDFFTSIWSENTTYRKESDTGIQQILKPELDHHINNVQTVFANFMVKKTGENSSLFPHQDWNFVNEPEFDSVTIWIPLEDVDNINGNLQVLPKSHNLDNYVRGRFYDAPFRKTMKESDILEKLVSIPMKAGDALAINSRLIHASPPNKSEKERIAVSIVLASKEAKLVHWYIANEKGQKTEKLIEVNSDFFWKYSCYDSLEKLELSPISS